jgi:hypothetical protein
MKFWETNYLRKIKTSAIVIGNSKLIPFLGGTEYLNRQSIACLGKSSAVWVKHELLGEDSSAN